MLETLFGNRNVERALFFLLINDECYATEVWRTVGNGALSPIQQALDRLEQGGVVVSRLVGRTRVYQFNPRYPFLTELLSFLDKAYKFLPEAERSRYEPVRRTRPRKKGKS